MVDEKRRFFPEKLKLADISPVFKKDSSIAVGNYRPASVLPTPSKLYERIMHTQIQKYIEPIFLHIYVVLCLC